MKHNLNQISNDLGRVDRAYASYSANNYLEFSDNDISLRARLDLISAVLWTMVILAGLFGMAFLKNLNRKRGRERHEPV